ncbi:hypothetical protein, partial [Andreprevotia sp. IGB-42]|uniref:hypothetical protein n=1 Tax=Andreprevotia sp. IGB-42 TaxID=2497473 RepID=UPI001356B21E
MVAIIGGNGLGLSGSSRELLGQNGVVGSAGTGNGAEAVYVNATTGNLTLQQHDTLLLGSGLQPDLLRTYNSNGAWDGDNNDQWRIGFYKRISGLTGTVNTAGSTIKRVDGDEFEAVYTYDTARGEYVTTVGAGAFDSLRYNAGTQQWTWKDGASGGTELYKTDGSGTAWRLATQTNAAGDEIRVQYNAAGQINRLESWGAGEATYNSGLDLVYSGTLLTEVGNFAKNSSNQDVSTTRVRYAYDTSNRLIKVTVDLSPEDGSTADGKAYVTNYTYDGTSKRLASISQTDGSRLEFTYDGSFRIATVKDVRGAGDIRTTTYTYNTSAKTTTITDPLNQNTVFTYDAAGQVTQIQYPTDDYGTNRTLISYDASGNVSAVMDGRNFQTQYAYDARGNLVYELRQNSSAVRRAYDADDRLTSVTEFTGRDPDGLAGNDATGALKTRFVYDTAGNLRFKITPEGRVSEYRYNLRGLRTQEISYTGGNYLATTATYSDLSTWTGIQDLTKTGRTDMAYDVLGQLQSVTTSEGMDSNGQPVLPIKTSYIYDAFGRLLQRIDARGVLTADANDYSTVYSYDGLGRVLTVSQYDANGVATTTTTVYDDTGRQTTQTQANGLIVTSTFDQAGRLLSSTERTGVPILGTVSYAYDKLDRRVQKTDEVGNKTYYLYDKNSRQVGEVAPDGALTEIVYNNAGQILQRVNYVARIPATTLASYASNPAGLTISGVRSAVGNTAGRTYYFYDSIGQLGFEVAEYGANSYSSVTEYRYDGAGRRTDVIQYAKPITTSSLTSLFYAGYEPSDGIARGLSSTYNADPANNRWQRAFYSDDGLLLAELDAVGALTEYFYNVAGQRTATLRYAKLTTSTLQQTGTLAQVRPVTDAADQTTNYLYNGRGQLVGVIDAGGALTEYRYDVTGNKQTELHYMHVARDRNATRLVDALPTPDSEDQFTIWTYDHFNRVVREERQPFNTVTTYTYDVAGNLAKQVTAAGSADERTKQWRYDAQGNLLVELGGEASNRINEAGAVTYGYDAAGRRISSTDGNGRKTYFYYDAVDRIVLTVNADGEAEELYYAANGANVTASLRYANRLSSTVLATLTGGVVGTALRQQLTSLADASRDQKTERYLDNQGVLRQIRDALGVVIAYVYNPFGEMERVQTVGADGNTWLNETREYDQRGALRFSRNQTTTVTELRYDTFGRLIEQVDPLGRISKTSYDAAGRVISVTDPTGASRLTAYDPLGRVYSTTDANGNSTRYTYNSSTRETTVTTPEGVSVTTKRNAQSEVVSVRSGEGHVTSYRYNLDGQLVQKVEGLNETDLVSYNDYDLAGNLIEVNERGIVTRLTYDASNRVLTRQSDPGGVNLQTEYRFDGAGRKIWEKRPDGVWTKTEFDARGRVKASVIDPATGPDGAAKAGALALRTEYTYDYLNNVVRLVEAAGTGTQRVTAFTYDSFNRRLTETLDPDGPLKLTTRYEYDLAGQVTARFDAANNATRFTYDAAGRPHYTVDALGGISEIRYDAAGNRIAETRYSKAITIPATVTDATVLATLTVLWPGPNGTQGIDFAARTTRYAYDKDSRLTHTVDALGNVSEQRFDGDNNVVQRIQYVNIVTTAWQTRAELIAALQPIVADHRAYAAYDALDRLVYSVDAERYVTAHRYERGNLASSTQYEQRITLPATINAASLAVATVATTGKDRTSYFTYDGASRQNATVDAEGYLTEYQFDQLGQRTATFRYAAKALASGFSPVNGAPISLGQLRPNTAGANDLINRASYDAAGRVLTQTDAAGVQTRYVYDARGLVMDRIQADGTTDTVTTHYDYDTAGRLIRESSAYGTADVGVTEYTLDALGNRVAILDPRNYALFTSDAPWAIAERTARGLPANANQIGGYAPIRAALSVTQRFDKLGRLTGITNQLSSQTQIDYDAFGNVVRLVDLNGKATYKNYDAKGQLTQSIDSSRFLTTYSYDAFGNMVGKRVYVNGVMGALNTGVAVQIYPAGGNGTLAAAYTSANSADFVFADQYDARNLRVASAAIDVMQADGTKRNFTDTISYNAFGQQATATNRANGTNTYRYDRNGQLLEEALPVWSAGQQVKNQYEYDAFGNRIRTIEAAGLQEQRITEFTYDKVGRQVAKLGQAANVYVSGDVQIVARSLERTFYDKRGNVTETQIGLQDANAPGQIVDPNRTLNFYDKANRVISQVTAEGVVTQRHYAAGGQVIDTTTYATRLASLPAQGSTVPPTVTVDSKNDRALFYTYDVVGRMATERSTSVVYSSMSGSTFQLNTGALQTTKYYDAVGNVIEEIDRRGNSILHFYDGEGRQIGVVDQEGYVTTWQYLPNRTVEYRYATKLATRPGRGLTMTLPISSADDRATVSELDSLGRVISKTVRNVKYGELVGESLPSVTDSATDVISTFVYDGLGNVIRQLDADGYATEMSYDALGRMTEQRVYMYKAALNDDRGTKTRFEYDGLGSLVKQTQVGSSPIYDRVKTQAWENGKLTSSTDAGNYITRYMYDRFGNLAYAATEFASTSAMNGTAFTDASIVTYDRMGRETSRQAVRKGATVTLGDTSQTSYNAFGEVTQRGINGGNQEWAQYDQLGRMVMSNTNAGVVTRYIYDANGNATLSFQAGANNEDVTTATAAQYNSYAKTITEFDKKNQSIRTYQPDFTVEDILARIDTANLSVSQGFTPTNPVTISVTKTAPPVTPPVPEVGQISLFTPPTPIQAMFHGMVYRDRQAGESVEMGYPFQSGNLTLSLPQFPAGYGSGDYLIEYINAGVTTTFTAAANASTATLALPRLQGKYEIYVWKKLDGQTRELVGSGTFAAPIAKSKTDMPQFSVTLEQNRLKTPTKAIYITGQPANTNNVQVWVRPLGSTDGWGTSNTARIAKQKIDFDGKPVSGWYIVDVSDLAAGEYEFMSKTFDASGNVLSAGEGTFKPQDNSLKKRLPTLPAGLESSSPSSKPGITVPNPGVTYATGLPAGQALPITITATSQYQQSYSGGPLDTIVSYMVNNITVPIPQGLYGLGDGYELNVIDQKTGQTYKAFEGGAANSITLPLSLSLFKVKVELYQLSGNTRKLVAASAQMLAGESIGGAPIPHQHAGESDIPAQQVSITYSMPAQAVEARYIVRGMQSDVDTLLFNYRESGSTGAYQQATLVKDETLSNTFYLKDAATLLQYGKTYEFNYFGLGQPPGANGPVVLVRQSGTLYHAQTGATFNVASTAPKLGGDGFSYVGADGLLNLVDQGRTDLTTMPTTYSQLQVRAVRKVIVNGQVQRYPANTWITVGDTGPRGRLAAPLPINALKAKVIDGVTIPGWFTVDSTLVMDANLINMGWGTQNTDPVWYHPYNDGQDIELDFQLVSYYTLPSTDEDAPPPRVTTNDVSVRLDMPTYRLSNGGQAQFTGSGKLNLVNPALSNTALALQPSNTVLYMRAVGQTNWSTVSLTQVYVRGATGASELVKGMFEANRADFPVGSGSYEVALTSYSGSTIISQVTGVIDTGNSVMANRKIQAYLPTVDYQNSTQLFPSQLNLSGFFGNGAEIPNRMRVTFTARSDGNSYSGITRTYDVTAQGPYPLTADRPVSFLMDMSYLIPDPTQNWLYDVKFESISSGNWVMATGNATVYVGAQAQVVTTATMERAPSQVTFQANDVNAKSAKLYYRLKSSEDASHVATDQDLNAAQPFAQVGVLVDANGYFTLDATKLVPGSGWRVYEYFYDLFDANGALLSRRSDTFTLGTGVPASNTEERWSYSISATRNLTITRSQTYNAFGQIASETDGLGRVRSLSYNTLGLLTERRDAAVDYTNAQGVVVTGTTPTSKYVYSKAGRLVATVDAAGKVTGYKTLGIRDAQGQALVEKELHADGGSISMSYDEFGQVRQRVETIEAGKNSTINYTYDKRGLLTWVTRDARNGATPTEYYEYDAAGRRTKATDANGISSYTFFDFAGRVVRTSNGAGVTTDYQYTYDNTIVGLNGAVVGGYRKYTVTGMGTADAR